MPAYEATHSEIVAASAADCFAALTDYEELPRWSSALERCRVLAWDEAGRGREVEYVVDAKVRTVSYRLRQDYEEPVRIASEYLGGDFRDFAGEWRLRERDGATRVTLSVRLDPGRFVPRPIARLIERAVVRQSVQDLKRHVEGAALAH